MTGKKFFFSKIKVQKQLYIIYLTAILVPVVLIGGYLVYSSRSLMLERYKELAYADNLRVKSLFLDITSNIYNRAVTLSSDGELIRILSTDYRLNPQGALDINNYPGFQNILSQDISIQQIQVYTYNKTVPQNRHRPFGAAKACRMILGMTRYRCACIPASFCQSKTAMRYFV